MSVNCKKDYSEATHFSQSSIVFTEEIFFSAPKICTLAQFAVCVE